MSYRYRVSRPAPVINLNKYRIEHAKEKENTNTTQELIEEIRPTESSNTESLTNMQYIEEKRGYPTETGTFAVIVVVLILLALLIDF